ncbi:MAG: Glyceraldehyde 3-phosphate dehydrogenase [Candidatus Giovannonibacteria bacterium GW2011_GWA2_53_7]|uniref:Glyceraldehyde 3-phosphate dehydrogenase n=1 Tax=Candidatus Giovannonibacteria bacterium GW2011_GWA2_53_7 TaxID=1618650 RepID=A0A0G1XWT6_9BACT|nr:MAG: Glyceraldehyde 3-phosphate dehydrogenase [Candidatus Giovannonibacteria bacterium GW2011_GWA2_53_7]
MGINHDKLATCQISSNASCTTNAVSPVITILHEKIGIEKAILNTTHAYTGTQKIVDGPGGKDLRGGRAAAQNMIPASTGAAIATTEAVPDLIGKFDGISVRVPVVAGSLADVTFIAKRGTSVEEVNQILRDAAKEDRWKGIFKVTDEPIVSSDIVWYDNEMGYTNTLVMHVTEIAKYL